MRGGTNATAQPKSRATFRVIRLLAGLTQEQLADLTRQHDGQVTTGFIAQIEGGWKSPSPKNARAIAEAIAFAASSASRPVLLEADMVLDALFETKATTDLAAVS